MSDLSVSNDVKKASILLEYLIGMGVIALMMGLMLFVYKGLLDSSTLGNETYALKRYLEYGRDTANAFQMNISWKLNAHEYMIQKPDGEVMNRHTIPKVVTITGSNVSFTPRLTPSGGQTITLRLGNRLKKVIIDPSTGRIRISS